MNITFESDDSSPDDNGDFVDADLLTEPVATSSSEMTCQVCGIDIAHLYAGRGRKPKFCVEHKPTVGSRTAASGSTRSVDTLIGQMAEMYAAVGAGLTFIPPTATDGMIISGHATSMAESWRPLILRDPKVRKFWEKMTTGGGWGTVIMAHSVVALAIMQAHNVQLPGFGNRNEVPAS